MSHVAVILTGGTISQRPGAAGSVPDADSTFALVEECCPPGISFRCVSAMERNSPDISPADWSELAGVVVRAVKDGADGIIILHGTDTLAYTAAAMAFALPDIDRPVVLTGSMLPGGAPRSDAADNIASAFAVACSSLAAVSVVFTSEHLGLTADILPATRVVKRSTAAPAAFHSVGIPPLGRVVDGEVQLAAHAPVAATGRLPSPAAMFEEATDLIKISPLTTGARLRQLLAGLKGVVLEGFGSGHVRADHLAVLREFCGPVIVSTQVLDDAERLGAYASDRLLTDIPQVIRAGCMTSTAALVKLSWALGQCLEIPTTMTRDLVGELRSFPEETAVDASAAREEGPQK